MEKKTMKVLVVDDMTTMRKIIKKCLLEIGYAGDNITEAMDGAIALEALKKNSIDLIICDWNMPNMTGIDLLKEIKKDVNLAKKPFLFVTAEAEKDNIITALKSGADNYIIKPFTTSILNEKLDGILKKYSL